MPEPAGPAVQARQLRRVYQHRSGRPATTALEGFDLTIDAGEVHGLLGPNGAGKTTLCRILSTVLLPTSGTARVLGYDVVSQTRAVRQVIGIVFGGDRGLYPRLTARQNLRYWSALYRQPSGTGRRRVETLLGRVGLSDRADDRVETFSRGMKQRLHLARGLIGDPRVLLLDEPTTGMDPVAAHEFRVLIGELRTEGRTVLLTTHDMAEAEAICDRVSLIDHGRLLATEAPKTIGRWLARYERVLAEGVPEPLVAAVAATPGVAATSRDGGGSLRVETVEPGAAPAVVRLLLDAGVTTVATSRPSLEEVYLWMIGDRGLRV